MIKVGFHASIGDELKFSYGQIELCQNELKVYETIFTEFLLDYLSKDTFVYDVNCFIVQNGDLFMK